MEEFELEPGEKITQSVRVHWIILVSQLLPFVLLAFLPLLFPFVVGYLESMNQATAVAVHTFIQASGQWLVLVLAFWWLFLWMSALSITTQYCLTVWIITTTRIVDIHQYGFFSRQVSSFLLNRVQDVTTDVEGVFETLFGFGTLNVETAGRDEKFTMQGIQHPVELRDLIMREVAALHADGQPNQSATGV